MAEPPATMSRDAFVQAVDHVIRQRKTAKILRDTARCPEGYSAAQQASLRALLHDIIQVASWAPVHKVAHKQHRQGTLSSPVPWRLHVLEKPACCTLVDFLRDKVDAGPDSHWARAWESKIPRLLAGAGALVMVTWLPDPPAQGSSVPELSENNIEHIAATSAAVQNLLLAAEARGLYTYWSSGGILNDAAVFDYLAIPREQMLLGAIFIALPDAPYDEQRPGALRDQRGEPASWSQWVTLS